MLQCILTITGVIGFLLWIPSIMRYVASFWYMRHAMISALLARVHLSIADMKIIDALLEQNVATFFRLNGGQRSTNEEYLQNDFYDQYHSQTFVGEYRVATENELDAIRHLVLLGYLVISDGGVSGGDVCRDIELHYNTAFITGKFKRVFKFDPPKPQPTKQEREQDNQ